MKSIRLLNNIKGAGTIKSEKGYTLILVMIIVSVTMILAATLSSSVISARKQFNKTENINIATDLAEMGITYYQAAINNLIINTQETIKVSKNDFCTEFTLEERNNTNIYSPKYVDTDGNKYKIDKTAPISCSNVGQFKFTFTSTGTTKSGEVRQLQGTIAISQVKVGKDLPDYSLFKDSGITKQVNYSIEFPSTTYPNGVAFNSGLTIVGGNILTVLKSAYFSSMEINGGAQVIVQETAIINKITSVNGNTNLIIYGDAIFLTETPRIDKLAGKANICIYGNIYTVKNNKLYDYTDFSNYFNNTCSNSNSSWTVNPESGVTVTY
ncbi:hypothetical protein [Neobacillus sp. 114]|uniref:type II secretion system protein n=1 Tax=Neobacillus sp. 114 TaxID=3048535 RepID=UPI0024C36480|nr:hypothetical protein [Neobacillus sp. 114]